MDLRSDVHKIGRRSTVLEIAMLFPPSLYKLNFVLPRSQHTRFYFHQ